MYLSYSKELPYFDVQLVQLCEEDSDPTKIYGAFQDGFQGLYVVFQKSQETLEPVIEPVTETAEPSVTPAEDPVEEPVEEIVEPETTARKRR